VKLEFHGGQAVEPKDAATIVLVRDAANGVEVFCVERSKQSKFMGGALVFPGGKVDAGDSDPDWAGLVAGTFDKFAVAAERETLEEACMLHVAGVEHETLIGLRSKLAEDAGALRAFLKSRSLKLDLTALHSLSRWITPEAETRRFDARFFVAVAPAGQPGAHDEHETTRSFWATAAEVLSRWREGEVQLAPPTHATIHGLAQCATTKDVIAWAERSSKEPICPKLVPQGDTIALALPGDREHDVKESRLEGSFSRYVLRGEKWQPENAP
jgi:8-oxo-dGTP pyrophosphatase MutT (NUDIX family)